MNNNTTNITNGNNEPLVSGATPLFSVLIANYNNGQYLQECIDSVFAQTYTNWEIILVDDGSTDKESFAIYDKYKDHPQIHIFYNDRNRGCGYTKMRTAEEAKGEFCVYLDPDDAITPNALEVMAKEQIANPLHTIIYSTHYVCDSEMNIKSVSGYPSVLSGEDYFTSKQGHISHLASFKLSRYRQTEGLTGKYKRAIDHDLYFKLEETGQSKFIPIPLYYYRHHSNSISINDNWWKAKYWDFMIMFDTYERRLKNGYKINRNLEDLNRRFDNYYYSVMSYFFNKKKFGKVLSFFCISIKYSNSKSLLKKFLLIALIPLRIFMPSH